MAREARRARAVLSGREAAAEAERRAASPNPGADVPIEIRRGFWSRRTLLRFAGWGTLLALLGQWRPASAPSSGRRRSARSAARSRPALVDRLQGRRRQGLIQDGQVLCLRACRRASWRCGGSARTSGAPCRGSPTIRRWTRLARRGVSTALPRLDLRPLRQHHRRAGSAPDGIFPRGDPRRQGLHQYESDAGQAAVVGRRKLRPNPV